MYDQRPAPKPPQPQPGKDSGPQPAAKPPNPRGPQWSGTFTGTLGRARINVTLQRDGDQVTGQYRYAGKKGHLTLEGIAEADGTIKLREQDEKGEVTGRFTLKFVGGRLHGLWYGAAGSAAFGVALTASTSPKPDSAPPPAPQPPPPTPFTLPGRLGRYAIHMTLTVQGQQVSGAYGYDRQGAASPLPLKGTVDAQGHVTLTSGQETFTGTLSADHQRFEGQWTAKGRTLPVHLGTGPQPDPPKPDQAGALSTVGLKGGRLIAAQAYNLHAGRLIAFFGETGIRPEVMTAIICAESGGWAGQGRPMLIRFEAHKFYSSWGAKHAALFDRYFKFNRRAGQGWKGQQVSFDGQTWQPLHPSGAATDTNALQYRALKLALSLGNGAAEAAYRCLGMGLGQVQGFNFQDAGFESAEAMFDTLSASEGNQVDMIFTFFRKRPRLIQGAVAEQFATVETMYNGGGQGGVYAGYMRNYTAQLRAVAQTQGLDLQTGRRP